MIKSRISERKFALPSENFVENLSYITLDIEDILLYFSDTPHQIDIDDEYCDIVSVLPTFGWSKTIRTQASSSDAFTNLEVQVNNLAGDIVVISWKEVPGP